jgi:hypothetical protein
MARVRRPARESINGQINGHDNDLDTTQQSDQTVNSGSVLQAVFRHLFAGKIHLHSMYKSSPTDTPPPLVDSHAAAVDPRAPPTLTQLPAPRRPSWSAALAGQTSSSDHPRQLLPVPVRLFPPQQRRQGGPPLVLRAGASAPAQRSSYSSEDGLASSAAEQVRLQVRQVFWWPLGAILVAVLWAGN